MSPDHGDLDAGASLPIQMHNTTRGSDSQGSASQHGVIRFAATSVNAGTAPSLSYTTVGCPCMSSECAAMCASRCRSSHSHSQGHRIDQVVSGHCLVERSAARRAAACPASSASFRFSLVELAYEGRSGAGVRIRDRFWGDLTGSVRGRT
jgi:hypothetical protein